MVKLCTKCNTVKTRQDFNKSKSRKDGMSSWCKSCNRVYANTQSKINRQYARTFVRRVKKQNYCLKCRESRWYLLDFHHIDNKTKLNTIAKLIGKVSGKPNMIKIKNEIRKCMLLCSNCHREFHFMEMNEGITISEYLKTKNK